jgi:hypothetical protein
LLVVVVVALELDLVMLVEVAAQVVIELLRVLLGEGIQQNLH